MDNSSEVTSFVLAAYGELGSFKYLYFILMLVWYLCICVFNLFLIVVIYVDRRLHEPMYILLCNLFLNEINGSTAVYPLMLSQMFSETHEVSVPLCLLQLSYLYTSASVEFCTLAAMAYDRYISICFPLYYSVMITNERVAIIIVLVWSYSLSNFVFLFVFIIRLEFCRNIIDKVFCDHHMVIKLACSVSTFSKVSDIIFAILCIVVPFSFILVSYLKILAVCLNTTKENKPKALSTCTPQIISLSNMFVGCVFHFSDSRFEKAHVPGQIRVILSVYLLICQPMITPFMYGFNFPKIRDSCRRLLFNRK